MSDNILLDKSKAFALRIIKMYKYLTEEKKEYILSKQVLRSGTSYTQKLWMSQFKIEKEIELC